MAVEPLNAPRSIAVTCDPAAGLPCRVVRDGRVLQVVSIVNDWCIDDEWWRETPLSRHYYVLELAPGGLRTVFQDRLTDTWWEQRA